MKKLVTIFTGIALIIMTLLCISGCEEKSELQKFFDNMENETSYEMETTINMSIVTIKMTQKVDDNISYTFTPSILGSGDTEEYQETVDNTVYTYTKDDSGKWTKDEGVPIDDTQEDESITDMDFFKADNFEYSEEKEAYILKEDIDTGDSGMSNVSIKFEEDATIISAEITSEGITGSITMTVKNIGKVELTLPAV